MTIRRRLGRLKYRLVDVWPFVFAQRRAAAQRARLLPRILTLPALEAGAAQECDLEAHMVCGKRDLDMGIASSWSLLRFFRNPALWVHSDGTLDADDLTAWRRVVPGLRLVERAEADARARQELASCPLLREWRARGWWGLQAVDIHLHGSSDALLSFDSDVLCFRDPESLKEALAQASPIFAWNRDTHDCYFADAALLREVIGEQMPVAFNAGFALERRLRRADFERLELDLEKIAADGRIDPYHYWAVQTFPAIFAARTPGSGPLPPEYSVVRGPTSARTVVRHFVGIPSIRPRYFLEGVPRLLSELDVAAGRAAPTSSP